MYKIFKIVLVSCICFNSAAVSAQLNEYLEAENGRISLAQETEKEVIKFVTDNFKNYKLSQEISEDVINHLKSEEEFTQAQLENALLDAKRVELRKLFFYENPDKKEHYMAKPPPLSIMQQCVNGDFESNTAGYSFWSDPHPQPASGSAFFLSCATPTALTATNVVTPGVNDFNSTITMIDNTSPGYQQFDPTLAGLSINVPTLNTNGGNKSIKLNNAFGMGSSDQTTMSRYFPSINQSTIDFNFSLIMDNKPAHGQPIQPFFRVRAYDQFNNIVDEICIIANPDNCLFNTLVVSTNRRVLYTGWICARLNVSNILNQPCRIEFTVSDCQPSAHFGTVYIDNICGFTCAVPQLGALSLDPTNINCPDVSNNLPIQVCGTYQAPVNATLNTLTLDVLQNNIIIGTINTPSQLTSNTFCFAVLPSIFGAMPSGDFEFNLNATFNVNCPAGTFIYDITDTSASIGPDVTFNNCCYPILTLTSPNDDLSNLAIPEIKQRERSDWIKAANIVSVGDNSLSNGVVYHAANYVELNPGFEAILGSQFVAYPEGCSANYVYKNENQSTSINQTVIDDEVINLVKVANGFAIIPNPSSSTIEIVMKGTSFNKVSITTIDGKVVLNKTIEKTDKTQLDVSRYANGIYIINVISEDGQLLSEKLIKN
ncbi:T9SS type A sorting domain-containing protein [Flavobacterium sp. RSB2_4_14]|uniref:T9SS type A sorting domain-containing protein n=1 Tax=Flavobacterium sp. RSB2_4_14 TaxID=3447665 RepID=UPI003F356AAF